MMLTFRILAVSVAAIAAPLSATDASPHREPRIHPRVTTLATAKPLSAKAIVEAWPDFLGRSRSPISTETMLLKSLDENSPRLLWTLGKGAGYSAPSIQGNRLLFFHRIDHQEILECLHPEDGRLYWQYSCKSDYEDEFGYGNGPRASPVIKDGRVYIQSAAGPIHCVELESGRLVWQYDPREEHNYDDGFFGASSTPLIEGDLLIVNVGIKAGPCVLALNRKTGQKVWSADDEWGASYASPVAATFYGKRRILVFAGGRSKPPVGGLLCIDPAKGRIDFRFPWRSKDFESVNAATPIVLGNQVFITASYGTGGAMIEVTSEFQSRRLWTTDLLGSHWSTPIIHEGHIYGIDGRHSGEAEIVCLKAESGACLWRQALQWEETVTLKTETRRLKFAVQRGSLLHVDGRFLCLSESGHLLWLDLSPQNHEVKSRKMLFHASQTWTAPVLSKGLLYVAQNEPERLHSTQPRLCCFDFRQKTE